MKKKENIIMGLGVLLLIVSIVGVSYAAFSYTGSGSKVNTITTGVLSMSYTESDNVISMDKALPTTDDTGKVRLKDGEYFDFTVSSTIEGSAIINYEVAAEALSSNTFDGKNVKLYLTKINGTTEEEAMPAQPFLARPNANTKTGRPANEMSLTTGTMGSSETIRYRLRMYVRDDYNPQDDSGNEVFQVRINIYSKIEEEPTGTLINAYGDSDFHVTEYSSNTTSIVTKDNNAIPSTAIVSWDISEAGDGKAVAYYEDDGTGTGTYKLTLGGEGGLIGNPDMSSYFSSFTVIKTMNLTYLNTSKVTNMQSMFAFLGPVDNLDLSMFNTSNVTNMSSMFVQANMKNVDVSSFDTSNVTDMGQMFLYCNMEKLDASNFSGANLLNVKYMFIYSNIKIIDLSGLGYSPIKNIDVTFQECLAEEIYLNSFYTPFLENTASAFAYCRKLSKLDISNLDTSNVTNMNNMFFECTSIVDLDLSNFYTPSLTSMSLMFYCCTNLQTLNLTNFVLSNVENIGAIFGGCSSLTSVFVSSKWSPNPNVDTSAMFADCNIDHVTYV